MTHKKPAAAPKERRQPIDMDELREAWDAITKLSAPLSRMATKLGICRFTLYQRFRSRFGTIPERGSLQDAPRSIVKPKRTQKGGKGRSR